MALILTRSVGESVIIDHDIKVTIGKWNKDKVKLIFEAPEDVRIDREEIHLMRKEDE